jgi:hypothetical protein
VGEGWTFVLKERNKSEFRKKCTVRNFSILIHQQIFWRGQKKAHTVDETCSTHGGDQTCNFVEKISRLSLKIFRPEFPKCTRDFSPKCQNRLWSLPASYSVGTGSKEAGA